jgi:hypothetical protein
MQPLICHTVEWKHLTYLSAALARKIKESAYTPDVLLAISRGGLVPARTIADFMLKRKLLCIQAEHWDVGVTLPEKVKITSTTANLKSKKVLVIDDVADTGDTLFEVAQHLRKQGASTVKTAVLHYKKTSTFKPDYYAEEMEEWQWIVYPWSIYEDTTNFIKKIIKAKPKKKEEIHHELAQTFKLHLDEKLYNLILHEMEADGMITKKENNIHLS